MVTLYPLNHEAFVWALSAFCQLNRVPFSAELLVKHHPPPYTNTLLEKALQSFGLNTSLKHSQLAKLNAASLPCLAKGGILTQARYGWWRMQPIKAHQMGNVGLKEDSR